MDLHLISVPFFVTAAGLVGLSWYAWRQERAIGARIFSLFMLSVGIYSLGYALELNSSTLAGAIFWSKVQYIGILSFPGLYLLFVYQYLGRAEWFNTRSILLLFSPAFLLYAVKLFDESLGWIYASAQMIERNSRLLFTFEPGPLYPYVSVYQVFTVTIATFLLIQKRRHASELFRRQTSIMLGSAAVVYIVFFTYLLEIPLHPSLASIDVNPLAFGILALGIGLAIFRHGFLDLVPVARATLVETLNDGIVVLDPQSRIVDANPKALQIFGWDSPPLGQVADQAMAPAIQFTIPDSLNGPTRQEVLLTTAPIPTYLEISLSSLRDTRGASLGYFAIIRDITDRIKVQQELKELSLTDDLTGLHNRRGFNMLAEQMLNMVSRAGLCASLFYCDIDDLKQINDCLGHAAGDQAIKDVADIFRSSFRASDVIARVSGDEFALLGIESGNYSADSLEARLVENTRDYASRERPFKLDFSTGIARFDPDHPKSLQQLLAEADQAMYQVKRAKKKAAAIIS